jgi:photosystem II stability/assembly factor-like uncharacterized protein
MNISKSFLMLPLLFGAIHAEEEVESQISTGNDKSVFSGLFIPSGYAFIAGTDGAIFRSRDSGATWIPSPKATFNDLHALCASGPRTLFAAGKAGTILRTTDGGDAWKRLSSGVASNLNSVHFPDARTGFAAGAGGAVIKTTDGGDSWRSLTTGIRMDLGTVHFPDPLHGFAAGSGDTLLSTSDGGATWTSRPVLYKGRVGDSTDRSAYLVFSQVHFFNPRRGLLVGRNPVTYGSGKHTTTFYFPAFLETFDGGISWSSVPGFTVSSIQAMGEGGVVAHDGGETLRTTPDQGETWNSVVADPPCRCYYAPVSLAFLDLRTGFVADRYGRIARTRDGGKSWIGSAPPLFPRADADFKSVHFPTPDTGYVAGGGDTTGRVFRTTDGGATWIPQASPIHLPLLAVHFPLPLQGVAAGGVSDTLGRNRGILLRTTDGGVTWEDKSQAGETTLRAVHFPTPRTGFVVGDQGVIRATRDSGRTWNSVASGTSMDLDIVHFLDENTGFIAGANPLRTGDALLQRTEDGGRTWHRIDLDSFSAPIASIAFATSRVGYILREEGGIFKTTDGGRTWSPQGPASDAFSLQFPDPDTGYAIGKRILKTVDGGATWSLLPLRWSGNYLTASSLPDSRTLYAIGPGTVVKMRNFPPTPIAVRRMPGRRNPLHALPGGRFGFELPRISRVTLRIIDPNGRTRASLLDRTLPAGRHELALSGWPCGAVPCILEFRADGVRQALPLTRLPR